jgi:hypothetical protein
MRMNDH